MDSYITIRYGGEELRFKDTDADGKLSARTELPKCELSDRLLAGKPATFDINVDERTISSILSQVPSITVIAADGKSHTLFSYKTYQYSAKLMVSLEEAAKCIAFDDKFAASGVKDRDAFMKANPKETEEYLDIIRGGQKRMSIVQAEEMFFMNWVRDLLEKGKAFFAGCPEGGYSWVSSKTDQDALVRIKYLQGKIDGYLGDKFGEVLDEMIKSTGESAQIIRESINTIIRNSLKSDIAKLTDGISKMAEGEAKKKLEAKLKELNGLIDRAGDSLYNSTVLFKAINEINGIVNGYNTTVNGQEDKLANIVAPYNMTLQMMAKASKGLNIPYGNGVQAIINIVLSARGMALDSCSEHWVLMNMLEAMPKYKELREKVFAGMETAKGDIEVLRKYYISLGIKPEALTDEVLKQKMTDFADILSAYKDKKSYETALYTYKLVSFAPLVQQTYARIVAHDQRMGIPSDTIFAGGKAMPQIVSLVQLLKLMNDYASRSKRTPQLTDIRILSDGTKSKKAILDELNAMGVGVVLGVTLTEDNILVAPGILKQRGDSGYTAVVSFKIDPADPDDPSINAVLREIVSYTIYRLDPASNTEGRQDDVSGRIYGDIAWDIFGKPGQAGYIDSPDAVRRVGNREVRMNDVLRDVLVQVRDDHRQLLTLVGNVTEWLHFCLTDEDVSHNDGISMTLRQLALRRISSLTVGGSSAGDVLRNAYLRYANPAVHWFGLRGDFPSLARWLNELAAHKETKIEDGELFDITKDQIAGKLIILFEKMSEERLSKMTPEELEKAKNDIKAEAYRLADSMHYNIQLSKMRLLEGYNLERYAGYENTASFEKIRQEFRLSAEALMNAAKDETALMAVIAQMGPNNPVFKTAFIKAVESDTYSFLNSLLKGVGLSAADVFGKSKADIEKLIIANFLKNRPGLKEPSKYDLARIKNHADLIYFGSLMYTKRVIEDGSVIARVNGRNTLLTVIPDSSRRFINNIYTQKRAEMLHAYRAHYAARTVLGDSRTFGEVAFRQSIQRGEAKN